MMFFDIFKGDKKPSNVVPFPAKEIPMPTMNEDYDYTTGVNNKAAAYTIGVNEHKCVQMRIGHTTVTMNDEGVITLIEDLAHYIRHTYDVEITPIGSKED
jgi:hypothetical protein